MDVLSFEGGGIALARKELENRGADFTLIVVHLRRVDAAGRQDLNLRAPIWTGRAHARYPA